MAGRLPGAVSSTHQLWDVLEQGQCLITDQPPERWVRACDQVGAPHGVYCGAFLEGIEHFDAGFFQLAQHDAMGLDPHVRDRLQIVAGADPDTRPRRCTDLCLSWFTKAITLWSAVRTEKTQGLFRRRRQTADFGVTRFGPHCD